MMHSSTLRNHADVNSFELEWDSIFKICLRKASCWIRSCPRCYETEDLAMMAAEKVWRVFDNYDKSKPLDKYVNTIAFSVFVDVCRGKNPYSEFSLDETRPGPTLQKRSVISDENRDDDTDNRPAYSVESESCSIALALEAYLACLEPRHRKVIEMSFGLGDCWWERTDDSIAEELHVSRQTVITDRKKAIERIKNSVVKGTKRVMAF